MRSYYTHTDQRDDLGDDAFKLWLKEGSKQNPVGMLSDEHTDLAIGWAFPSSWSPGKLHREEKVHGD